MQVTIQKVKAYRLEGEANMFRLLLALALTISVASCSWFQGDEEELEVSDTAANAETGDNIGNQELGFGQQEEGLVNEGNSFDNQIGGGENSSVAETNPLLNSEEGVANQMPEANMNEGASMPPADFSGDGGVVRYTLGETNVYAQPDTASSPVRSLDQGEVLLVTINGDFAQSVYGFIAVADLSAELQPRPFIGNDWQ